MASPSSSSSTSFPSPPPRSPFFTPIPENENGEKEEEEEGPEEEQERNLKEQHVAESVAVDGGGAYKHNPTPLHPSTSSSKPKALVVDEDISISCNKCRPSARDKIFVVPLDAHSHKHPPSASPSPNNAGARLRSLFHSLTRRSPASTTASAATSSASAAAREAEEWRLAAAELSRKLIYVTRKRDEALLEASRLKYSLAELERKVDQLESHCRDLKAALDRCPAGPVRIHPTGLPFPADAFRRAVAEARAAVRHLARSLTGQIRLAPPSSRTPADRIATLIQPYDPRAAAQWRRNPGGGLLFYMEALMNRVFYSGFEAGDEDEGASLIDPAVRCELNRTGYEAVRGLGWDEVLSKGTKHYSEGLSRFCDRKMSEVVGLVGWNRAWPEGLLQAFFGAAKGAWVVRLMARSVHPAVPVLRVDQGARFDGEFMEDVAADRVQRLRPISVRIMVAPGFHVYTCGNGDVVKCKVLCVYNGGSITSHVGMEFNRNSENNNNGRKSFES